MCAVLAPEAVVPVVSTRSHMCVDVLKRHSSSEPVIRATPLQYTHRSSPTEVMVLDLALGRSWLTAVVLTCFHPRVDVVKHHTSR